MVRAVDPRRTASMVASLPLSRYLRSEQAKCTAVGTLTLEEEGAVNAGVQALTH
jgi:hypothetical protein